MVVRNGPEQCRNRPALYRLANPALIVVGVQSGVRRHVAREILIKIQCPYG